ncbi:MAG TPA: methyltransferase domain-containing protein [Ramlibacter sp.]|nr:methyltransferase domain-containing protein [Ramlibacter sp.]
MSQPHFVKDYEAFVEMLLANFSTDEAMSHAVGGAYGEIGQIERVILEYAGLKPGMSLIDVGCGSGRLASSLTQLPLNYLGTDVVQKLLDYAQSKAPPGFKFVRHVELSVPVESDSVDMICAFSVFTHLQHTESYIYLTDFLRALKPGGMVVFSFLEFSTDDHWSVFASTVEQQKAGTLAHLNMFIERSVIEIWCRHLGFEVVQIVNGADAPWAGSPLGQCTAILRKPVP